VEVIAQDNYKTHFTAEYTRPLSLFNKHIETIYPAIFRRIKNLSPVSERIHTPDNDFLDLDWYLSNSKKLVILSHGLEGNARRGYVIGMAKAFTEAGYDALAWNFRGCSGEMNLTQGFYHSGATADLHTVVEHVLKKARYESVSLIGFSLGGNLTLKYLGEKYSSIPSIESAVAISVPLDLNSSCTTLSGLVNWPYSFRFLRSLKAKVKAKGKMMPIPNLNRLDSITNLRQFDDYITGPLHGFADALDYYKQCSSKYFINHIKTPTLVINAQNDPFLSEDCYPENVPGHPVQFQYPAHGGHVGFTLFNEKNLYWSEIQALQFINGITLKV